MTFTCSKCTSNTILKSDGPDMLLVNTIGSYSGTRLIHAESNSVTSRITISAEGAWTLSVHDINDARRSSGSLSARGDDVVVVDGSVTKARITNARGESNFVVKTTEPDGDQNLAVTQIGGHSGTVPLTAPAIVEVQSDGERSITPR